MLCMRRSGVWVCCFVGVSAAEEASLYAGKIQKCVCLWQTYIPDAWESCFDFVIWLHHTVYHVKVQNSNPAKLILPLHLRWVCVLDGLR